jgi:hypothetical protein
MLSWANCLLAGPRSRAVAETVPMRYPRCRRRSAERQRFSKNSPPRWVEGLVSAPSAGLSVLRRNGNSSAREMGERTR